MQPLLLRLTLLLQDTPAAGSDAGGAKPPGFMDMLPMLGLILLVFYFIAWRPQAKERRAREAMLAAVKKGDKVITTSGLFGTVAAVSDHDITLKVDEKNNIRMRFARHAVQKVLNQDEAPEEAASGDKS